MPKFLDNRSSRPKMSCKKGALKNLQNLLVRGNSTKKNHNTSVCDRSMEIGTHDQDDLRKCFFKRDT